MDVQIIYREGEPEFAVLSWADYQQLLRETGRVAAAPAAQPAENKPQTGSVPLAQLASLREERNMTLEALAREAGISPSYLAMIERGEREPSPVLLRSLGRLFDVQQWDV